MSDSIGEDLKATLEEVGLQIEILRSGETSIYEYAQLIPNRQVTKPFVLEFFREATLPYDSEAIPGDIVRVGSEVFLVINKTPYGFENETYKHGSFFYKCNVSGQLKRYAEPDWDADYHKDPGFNTVRSNCYALMTEGLFAHGIEEEEELARIGLANNECYMPTSYGAQLEDRFEAVSGEYYIVQSVKKRRFTNVSVLVLNEDTR